MKTRTIVVILAAFALASCSLTVDPDGSRTWTMSGEEAAKALKVLSQK